MTNQADWEAQLSVLEKNVYLDYFRKIDSDNKGIVLQDEATPFLKMSAIPDNILMQFWTAADNDKKGFLTSQEFCVLLKLIACAQHGIMTAEPILSTKVPLPDFSGSGTPRMQSNTTGTPPPPLPPPSTTAPATPLSSSSTQEVISHEDRMKYIQLFQSFGPTNNILSGEQARQAFMRSNLPPATLQAIWNLADTRRSGSLNQTEFIIAMYYIERAMKGNTQFPASLPPNIYASATGRMTTGGASPLMRKNTLQVPNSPPPIPSRSPVFKGATVTPVDITPEEFNKYQVFFRQLDTDQSGYVTGADAVVFFKHSKLPESDLARIWDLADTRSSGQLNEQEFAMAMHLINRRIAGGDIPSHMPSFRSLSTVQPQQQEQAVDLLGLSSDTTQNNTPATNTNQQQQSSLERTQTLLKANLDTETSRAQQATQQWQTESQAVQQLLKQIEEQKQLLAKKKQEADEAEQKLALERKRKEELTKELQMYKQEVKHYHTRIEDIQQETEKLQKENQAAPTSSAPTSSAPTPSVPTSSLSPTFSSFAPTPSVPTNDLFSLSTTPQTVDTKASSGSLFAKVNDQQKDTPPSSATSPQQAFDPFAGFKQQQQQQKANSPTVTLNQLKQEAEAKRKNNSPQIDIQDIESKFPDLTTMEQNFPTSPKPVSNTVTSPKPEQREQPSPLFAQPTSADTVNTSKYGFDLSAFESPSLASSPFGQENNVKDELSSLFKRPSLPKSEKNAGPKQGFDDIFNTPVSQEQKSTFENIFMQK